MDEPTLRVLYQLDASDRIRATGGDWDRFALANGAADLGADAVLRHPLWKFVAGEEVRELLRMIFARARFTGRAIRVPFRCDSPAERRFMELEVRPLPEAALEIESRLVRSEPRRYVPLMERSARLRHGMVSICSWCLRFRMATGQWVEVEEAVGAMGLFASTDLPTLSHGICRSCAEQVFGTLAETVDA
jgi:hypothetical protein